MTRRAEIDPPKFADDGARERWESQMMALLPANYTATKNDRGRYVIEGEDVAGWTLIGYVIPRLASGLVFAREVVSE